MKKRILNEECATTTVPKLEAADKEGLAFLENSYATVEQCVVTSNKNSNLINRQQGPKLMGLPKSKLLQCFNLRAMFRVLGTLIGTYPWAFLISTFIIASLSLGMINLKIQNRVRDGYTPATSISRYENDVIKEFFGSSGDPLVTSVLIRAKDGGSMHRLNYLQEAVQMHSFILKNISANFLPDALSNMSGSVRYIDICGPFCDANVIIDYFFEALKGQLISVKAGKKLYPSTNLSYPIARVNGYELHLERNFFGVSSNKSLIENRNGSENQNLAELNELSQVTSITYIEALLLSFRGDISHPNDEAKMSLWEMTLYKFIREQYNNSLIEVLVLGNEIVDYEMNRDAQRTSSYFAMGFLFMFTFAFLTQIFSSAYYGILDWAKFMLAMCISLCPTLAITSTFGVCALVGLRTNSVMLIMPFLICGIGVNDAFLICHSWYRLASCYLSIADRLGLALEEVGPSITITTLTNVITFGIGALTPTPEISLFCLATAIALGFAYIYTLTLFTSFLYFATVIERKNILRQQNEQTKSGLPPLLSSDLPCQNNSFFETQHHKLRNFCKKFGKVYCKMLTNRLVIVILIIGTMVYWYFAALGTYHINAKLDTEKILPKGCPILEPHRIVSHMVWMEYYPVTVIVNNPIDIRSKTQLDRFNAMVNEFEALNKCKGKEFTVLWLRDYIKYMKMVNDYGFDYYSDENYEDFVVGNKSIEAASIATSVPANRTKFYSNTETGLDFPKLTEFLSSPFYKHYSSFIKFANSSLSTTTTTTIPVSKFWFLVTYHNTTDWQDRIDLMQEWRRVAQKYKDMNVTVWEVNGMFVDQMLSLKSLTLQTAVLTLACMTVVCAIFIQNPLSVATAVIAIGSITIGVIGYLSWWDLNLDPVTLCAVLMSIGMSVDFTAHICYSFQIKKCQKVRGKKIVVQKFKTSYDKLSNTINSVAWPMTEAGLSTVICVLPLAFLQDYIPLVFVKTVFLVVLWGLLHGLVLMSAFLASLPTEWLELNCYNIFFKKTGSSSPPPLPTDSLSSTASIGICVNNENGSEEIGGVEDVTSESVQQVR